MAIDILPREQTGFELMTPSFTSGLQALLNTKMQGMQQQQMAKGLQALGVPGQLATMPPELLQHIVPQYMKTQAEMPIANLRQQIVGGQGMTQGAQETQQGSASMGAYDANGNITVPEINRRRQLINQLSQSPGGYKAAEAEEKTLNDLIKNRQEFMKGERELSLKERELGIKHAERAEEVKTKKQQQLEAQAVKENAPWIKDIETKATKFSPVIDMLDEYENILDSGQAVTGTAAALYPTKYIMPEATRKLYDLSKSIVNQVGASEVKGMMSRARQKLLEESKLDITQSPEEQRNIIRRFRKTFAPDVIKNDLRKQIVTENNNIQPRNLEGLVEERYKKLGSAPYLKSEATTQPEMEFGESLAKLPPAKDKPNKKYYDEEKKVTWYSDGTKWTKV